MVNTNTQSMGGKGCFTLLPPGKVKQSPNGIASLPLAVAGFPVSTGAPPPCDTASPYGLVVSRAGLQ